MRMQGNKKCNSISKNIFLKLYFAQTKGLKKIILNSIIKAKCNQKLTF